MAASAAGSSDFEDWVRPHWAAMRRLAERLAGPDQRDDVLQEALTTAWRIRERFDPERGSASAWLLGITAKHAQHARRSVLRRRHEALPELALDAPAPPDPDLARAIAALPPRQRLAVELCYFVGLTQADAATLMNCAEGTVKSTLSAARAALRADLGEEYR